MRKKLQDTEVNNHMFTNRVNKIEYETFVKKCEKFKAINSEISKANVLRVLMRKFNKGDFVIAISELEEDLSK